MWGRCQGWDFVSGHWLCPKPLTDFQQKEGLRDYRKDYNGGTHGKPNGDNANAFVHD